ncbi:MAG: hypothetical protein ACI4OT_03110 [Bacilli bacterium]
MKDKKNKITIKEILQDKQKRAILILALYFVFFLVLTISIRTNYKPNSNDDTATIINNQFAPEKITLDNYSFEYTIMKDGILHTYNGKRYQQKEQFTYNNNEYFKEADKFYKKVTIENEITYEEVENPYVYSEYLDFDNLNQILEKSEYNSTTTFKDDSKDISYYMYLNDELTENTITLTAKDNLLEKIEINLDKDSIILNFTEQNKILDFNK